jgi:hypothetical protein
MGIFKLSLVNWLHADNWRYKGKILWRGYGRYFGFGGFWGNDGEFVEACQLFLDIFDEISC